MYGPEAVDRIHWIVKLQAIGFTLAEIQGFVGDFQDAGSGREATARVRALFTEKQAQIREQIIQLQVIENDLSEALAYLDSCQTCTDDYAPTACGECDHHGHQKGEAPPLFAGLSRGRGGLQATRQAPAPGRSGTAASPPRTSRRTSTSPSPFYIERAITDGRTQRSTPRLRRRTKSVAIPVPEGVSAADLHGQPLDDARSICASSRRCCRSSRSTTATRRAATTRSAGPPRPRSSTRARQIAALLGGDAKEIVWTSGATEANNLAIKGAASFLRKQGNHIITVETEHKSVLDTCKRLQREGFEVTYLTPAKDGLVTPEQVTAAMTDKTILVTIMLANNEIGVVQPIEAIGAAIKAKNPKTLFHTDAVQGFGKIAVQRREGQGSTWRRSPRTSCTAPRASARCGCAASRGSASIR